MSINSISSSPLVSDTHSRTNSGYGALNKISATITTQPTKNNDLVTYTAEHQEDQITINDFHEKNCCQTCCTAHCMAQACAGLGGVAIGIPLGALVLGGTCGVAVGSVLSQGSIEAGIGMGVAISAAGGIFGGGCGGTIASFLYRKYATVGSD
ncbi:MAG: hypothetical protein HAW66_09895 [Shewanella sp.]|nr:hypothetical protein [Shewanella sp.]